MEKVKFHTTISSVESNYSHGIMSLGILVNFAVSEIISYPYLYDTHALRATPVSE